MPSASNTSNSSNIRSTSTLLKISQVVGSRLIAIIPSSLYTQTDNFIIGDAIRYDISLQKYKKSLASSPETAEVFGVIESISEDGSLNVVTYGAINIPSDRLVNLNSPVNYGGNDIYFLSDTIAGKLQNTSPETLGHVIKPVYQIAPTSESTGTIVNYVGYVIVNTG